MTATDPNERMALLLGWERRNDWWLGRGKGDPDWFKRWPPDFSQWDRFQDLQSFARERFADNELPIILAVNKRLQGDAALYMTPTMLRDALLEVCDGDNGPDGDARGTAVEQGAS